MKSLLQFTPTLVGYTIATSSGAGLAVGVCHLCHPEILTDEEKIKEALKQRDKEWDDKARKGKKELEAYYAKILLQEADRIAKEKISEDRESKKKLIATSISKYEQCHRTYVNKHSGSWVGLKLPPEGHCKVDLP